MSGQVEGDQGLPRLSPVSTRRHAIRWDEANLEANEEIKRTLNPQQILEPKTPYLSPMDTDEELELGMSPLKLDEGESEDIDGRPGPDLIHTSGSGLSDSSTGRSPRVAGRSPRFSQDAMTAAHDGDVESPDPERQEKRRRFKEMRKQHYQMRLALQR